MVGGLEVGLVVTVSSVEVVSIQQPEALKFLDEQIHLVPVWLLHSSWQQQLCYLTMCEMVVAQHLTTYSLTMYKVV